MVFLFPLTLEKTTRILLKHDETVFSNARKIAKLSVPYDVAYRLFVSLVSLVIIILLLLAIHSRNESYAKNTRAIDHASRLFKSVAH